MQITGGLREDNTKYTLRFVYPQALSTGEATGFGDSNENSAVVLLDYHNCKTLFMGDAPAAVEEQILLESGLGILQKSGLDLSGTDILKVSHHGSGNATTAAFLEYLGVQDAVISCGEGNLYGHPDAGTLQRLNEAGVTTHRTDREGTIVVTIDQNGHYTITKNKS